MHIDTTFPPPADRVGAFLAVADNLDSAELGAAIDALIERLDAAEVDPDGDGTDGDELDGNSGEDDFMRYIGEGPGCQIADSDEGSEERGEPSAWIEWQSRGRYKLEYGGEQLSRDRYGDPRHEDDEDDDPAELVGDETDGNGAEDDCMRHSADGPGCPLADTAEGGGWVESHEHQGDMMTACSDDAHEDDDVAARQPHRDRLRATRCDVIYMGVEPYGWREWHLREGSRRGGIMLGAA